MLKPVVNEEKKFKHSPWAAADNPLGPNFDVNRKASSLWSFVASLKRISSTSDFIPSFYDLINIYIAAGLGQKSPGDKILMSTETSCHFGHLLQVSKMFL